jgi:ring-1,2-phenylacetyl-CoA epoxidase subunit PaaD
MLTEDTIWDALDEIPDPEIPIVTLVEMGIIRDVDIEGKHITVTMTPTFSGCPALEVMKDDIKTRLSDMGAEDVTVETSFSPPWTSDWITEEARDKLRDYGIAPPPHLKGQPVEIVLVEPTPCPRCEATNTDITNMWGPTACKTLLVCRSCGEPFEAFKPL